MLSIQIRTIPHTAQRYPTCGDWWWEDDGHTLQVRVSVMGDWRWEFLVAVHELVEVFLCKLAGVNEAEVTYFDIMFEKEREEGKHSPDSEPGFDKRAPYRKQHRIATWVERFLALCLYVNWKDYNEIINNL